MMSDTGPAEHERERSEAEGAESAPSARDAWREALASRRTELPRGMAVRSAQASRRPAGLSRRRFVLGSFWGGLGVSLLGGVGGFLDFLYPRNVKGFGGPVAAGNVQDYPRGGAPVVSSSARTYLVNLDADEDRPGGAGGGSGLLALWWKCPHLGCTVPWRGSFDFGGDGGGWYRCPCHGSTYTKAGVRVFGPAPRSMDTMELEIDDNGGITVHTGRITPGGPDNPRRAVSHPLLPN